ncbi:uncharacterized protein PG986_006472 [Apiospora aurea]|uniref:F-box domain-containing protein n=1 Tax=Apiospora aurea TaxID=335848 RepID=A0ABR1QKR5_9PEZI
MAAVTFPLDSLPVEILCCIIRHLDPITLVAFSQTSSHYRRVISPSKLNHVERLLALELLEEHGGVTTIFRPKHNIISPDWRDPACDSMRWACTSCLRLLPHAAFGNHFILGLGYRKPEPGSPAAEPVSSWEPSSRDAQYLQSLKRYKQRPDVVFGQKRLRRQYSGACTGNYWRYATARDAAMPPGSADPTSRLQLLMQPPPAGFARARKEMAAFALEHERRNAGHKRHLRRCLECNWRRGELRPHTTRYDGTLGGTPAVPVAHSRQLYYGCALYRYFPGFSAPAGNEGPPMPDAPVFVIYRQDATRVPFTLHMARCPGCARWQELRAFRVGAWYPRWSVGYGTRRGDFENWDGRALDGPAFFDGLVCNHCLAASGAAGTERLRHELLGFWLGCANRRLADLADRLRSGFMQLYYAVMNVSRKYPCKRVILKEIIPGVIAPAFFSSPPHEFLPGSRYFEPPPADLAFYRLRYGQWLDAFEQIKDDADMQEFFSLREGFLERQESILDESYDATEAHYIWLYKCKKAVLENPQLLVDWALARDGATLS